MADIEDTKPAYGYDEGEENALVMPQHDAAESPARVVADVRLKQWLTHENCLFLENVMYCFRYEDLFSITKDDFEALSKDLAAGEKIRFRQALEVFGRQMASRAKTVKRATTYKGVFKVILIGNNGVGKTNILSRFTKDEFDPLYQETMGLKYEDKTVEMKENKNAKLQIYDTSGSHEFGTISQAFFREAHGAIIIYDVTDQKSFDAIEKWVEKVNIRVADKAWKILIANKCDLEECRRVITKELGSGK